MSDPKGSGAVVVGPVGGGPKGLGVVVGVVGIVGKPGGTSVTEAGGRVVDPGGKVPGGGS